MNIKKMLLLALSVGALVAFAVPTVASAAQLTDSTGSLPVGETINGTSTNTVTETELGKLTCEHVEIHGIVQANEGGNVVAGMDGEEDTATGCEIATALGTFPATISPTFEGLTASGAGPGHAAFTFKVESLINCEAEGVESESEVTWDGSDVIQITTPVTGSCGDGTLTGSFELTDGNGEVIAED